MAQDDATELLERESALVALRAQIQGLSSSGGGCALIVGDAGIGKTSLLRALRADVAADVVWWMGSCEPLLTPPPLAPWLDMLPQLPPRMAEAVRSERVGSELFADMLSLLQTTVRPLVIVVEDVHWADGATRDLLRFLGRRIRTTRALLILSWREHELGPAHPLRTVLAGLDAAGTQRHVLAPLSPGAVARLARSAGRDAEDLYRASAGNPFFVRQLLAAPVGVGVPAQVRDALLARVAQLPEAVREVLEMVSLSPVALELDVLRTAIGPHPEVLQAALHSGLLRCEQHRRGDALSLIHDITRATLAESLGTRAAALHAALFDALGQHAGQLARLVHHAELAGLSHAVVRLAPQAARQAAAARSHRQAAALYALVLGHAAMLDPCSEAVMAEAHADECLLVNQLDDAMASRGRALALARDAADRVAQGRHLRVMARIEWLRGRPNEGLRLADVAIGLLQEAQPEGREWAMACLTMGQLHLLADDPLRACDWVDRALPRLRALGDREAEAYALNTAGAARLGTAQEDEGLATLQQALRMALDGGQEELAARAWTNLAAAALVQHRLADLEVLASDGIAYCRARDLELYAVHLEIRRGLGWVAAGRWAAGAALFEALAARADLNPVQRDQLPWLRAFLAVRQGLPGSLQAWRRLAEGDRQLHPLPWYFDPMLMRVEVAWLSGEQTLSRQLAQRAWAEPARQHDAWRRAEMVVWRRRLGLPTAPAVPQPEPLRRVASNDPAEAAGAWEVLGLPYEQALALAEGDEAMRRLALAKLQVLGALPAVRRLRSAMRAEGVRDLPRGPYTHARRDELGLTARQREVLDGLRRGLSNREIAAILHRSERTVEHHVAALIDKLGARDRHDAVRRAAEN